jgi:hypothetical protein
MPMDWTRLQVIFRELYATWRHIVLGTCMVKHVSLDMMNMVAAVDLRSLILATERTTL